MTKTYDEGATYTGVLSAPTASAGTSTTQVATTAFVAAGFQPATVSTSITSSATPSIAVGTVGADINLDITALAVAITSFTTNLTGTPTNFQKIQVRIKDNGTTRTIAWGASFASRGATLPTSTVAGKWMTVGLEWNATTSTWDCVAVSQEV